MNIQGLETMKHLAEKSNESAWWTITKTMFVVALVVGSLVYLYSL